MVCHAFKEQRWCWLAFESVGNVVSQWSLAKEVMAMSNSFLLSCSPSCKTLNYCSAVLHLLTLAVCLVPVGPLLAPCWPPVGPLLGPTD